MSVIVGQDWRNKKYRELWIQYQIILLEKWDHTSRLISCFAGGKNTTIETFHPYRVHVNSQSAIKIEPKRLFDLPEIIDGERISIIRKMVEHG